jgi:multiple sugar transport system substrate-binding protein
MDKLTALHGAVGVRLSTWSDAEVRELVPLYRELEGLSAQARTLPFCEDLPRLATIINRVTIEALGTDEASEAILARAQATALRQGLRLS